MTRREKPVDAARRRLLAGAAGLAVVALAPGVTLVRAAQPRPAGTPASAKVRWGLLIDTNRDAAVWDACVDACREENGWHGHDRPTTDPQWIRRVDLTDARTGATRSLPYMCQHCEHPPCVDVCPTGASFRRADGIVLVDKHICIGCRYCMLACPFAARSFVHELVADTKPHMPRGKGTVESCTLCVHRIDAGRIPACVEAAAEADPGAVLFGDLGDSESEIAKAAARHVATRIRADLGLDQGVLYRGF
jgi:molybdopterin-containing oxidoreductase family iron-sulfur binding subunit